MAETHKGITWWHEDQLRWDQISHEILVLNRTVYESTAMSSTEGAHLMAFDRIRPLPIILVVEDEMMIRMSTVDMVEDAGYTPVEAVDADGAVAILESRSDVDLMVTDVQMPGSMNGLELAQAVHERWPLIKIIVVSGNLKQPVDLPLDSCFFDKPLDAEGMISQMRSMIDHA